MSFCSDPQPSTSRGGGGGLSQSCSSSQNTLTEMASNDQMQKLALKTNYMSLLDNAYEIVGSGNTKGAIARLNKVVDKANELFSNVNDPSEMFLDAKIFNSTSVALEQVANNLDVGEGNFKLFVFAEQFRLKALNDDGEPSWEVLAAQAQPIVQNSLPNFSPLLGSFEFSIEEQPEKERKVRQQRPRDVETEKKQPEKLTEVQGTEKGVEKIVLEILKKLKKIYKSNGQKPVSYFRFVVDPTSFAATVENIFHVSFLVHDDAVKLELDDDVGILISPVAVGRENSDPEKESSGKELKQSIMSIDMDMWKDLIDELNIERAMI